MNQFFFGTTVDTEKSNVHDEGWMYGEGVRIFTLAVAGRLGMKMPRLGGVLARPPRQKDKKWMHLLNNAR